jgi:hypothetical protein
MSMWGFFVILGFILEGLRSSTRDDTIFTTSALSAELKPSLNFNAGFSGFMIDFINRKICVC